MHRIFTWKTLNGKNHGSPQTPIITMFRCTVGEHKGNNLLLTVFATGGGYNGGNNLSLSLSLYAAALFTLAPTRMANTQNEQHTTQKFALGHIYTDMTFGLFTNIASRALGKHIHEYVPAS